MDNQFAAYAGSYPTEGQCPKDMKPEYAFIGRSNVGKSSLINMLVGRKNLAHISKKPGKTQMINYYLIDRKWYLVDLPGYGYAKISKKKRHEWRRMVEGYLQKRMNLFCAFILIDANVTPQAIDLEFINWMGSVGVPFGIVFTKVDKSKPDMIQQNIENFKARMLEEWEQLPDLFETSAVDQGGKETLLSFINRINLENDFTVDV